ncbi:MAG: biotin--[acetyl-CoA-carboxylase] ligase [Desulfoprunum sp.]|uniref:biotin--[acetyl-CoA-carboxylase] ligase n=1 Tax=Desulfoprunum sp. TaxID=2020866 RepID=UPI003C711967
MKKRILEMLRETSQPLSGQEISRRLEVSRVAVWKHISQLKQSGLAIESTARGYRLLTIPDTPFPWLFGPRSALIHYHPELDSTMNRAMDLARAGCPPYTVVVADRQLQGRGRMQRQWQSEEGGLYFSMVLRPTLLPRVCPVINLAVALDLVATLARCCGIPARVKWPNDVLVDGRKIAGILSQMEVEADQVAFINVGIGLNLNNRPEIADKPAVSALQLTGRRSNRAEVLADFLHRFEARMAAFSRADVLQQWRERTITLGRRVAITTLRDSCEGLAVDIDDEGGLILEMADGARRTVFYGDCFHT